MPHPVLVALQADVARVQADVARLQTLLDLRLVVCRHHCHDALTQSYIAAWC